MKAVAIDLETTGLGWNAEVTTIGVAFEQDGKIRTRSVTLTGVDLFTECATIPQARDWLQGFVREAEWLVFHNASFDLAYLLKLGLLTADEIRGRCCDTLILAATTGPHESMGLQALATEFNISASDNWGQMKAKRANLSRIPSEEISIYCEQDCEVTYRLWLKLWPKACEMYTCEWIAGEGDYCLLLAQMRERGVRLNMDFVRERLAANKARGEELLKTILIPNGINSPGERTNVLNWLNQRGWKAQAKTKNDAPSLDEEALIQAKLQLPDEVSQTVLSALIEARGLEKESSTYLAGYLEHVDVAGFVHPLFSAGGTRTWRLSSSNPNAQNIPKELQDDLFTASEPGGSLVVLDYSQAQLRLAAMYAQETEMAKLFALPDTDIHTATAIALFGPEQGPKRRAEGKGANFSVLFGSGASGVALTYKLPFELAVEVLQEHRRRFPRLQSMSRTVINKWKEEGVLILPYGKRNWRKASDPPSHYFAGWNYLIQGAEGTIMQHAMMEIDKAGLTIVSQVHDSLYINVPSGVDPEEVLAKASRLMESAVPDNLSKRTNPRIVMPTEGHIKRRLE